MMQCRSQIDVAWVATAGGFVTLFTAAQSTWYQSRLSA